MDGELRSAISFTATLLRDLHHFHQGARLRVSLERSGFMTLSPAGSNEEAGFWAGPGFASYEYGVVLGPSTSFIV